MLFAERFSMSLFDIFEQGKKIEKINRQCADRFLQIPGLQTEIKNLQQKIDGIQAKMCQMEGALKAFLNMQSMVEQESIHILELLITKINSLEKIILDQMDATAKQQKQMSTNMGAATGPSTQNSNTPNKKMPRYIPKSFPLVANTSNSESEDSDENQSTTDQNTSQQNSSSDNINHSNHQIDNSDHLTDENISTDQNIDPNNQSSNLSEANTNTASPPTNPNSPTNIIPENQNIQPPNLNSPNTPITSTPIANPNLLEIEGETTNNSTTNLSPSLPDSNHETGETSKRNSETTKMYDELGIAYREDVANQEEKDLEPTKTSSGTSDEDIPSFLSDPKDDNPQTITSSFTRNPTVTFANKNIPIPPNFNHSPPNTPANISNTDGYKTMQYELNRAYFLTMQTHLCDEKVTGKSYLESNFPLTTSYIDGQIVEFHTPKNNLGIQNIVPILEAARLQELEQEDKDSLIARLAYLIQQHNQYLAGLTQVLSKLSKKQLIERIKINSHPLLVVKEDGYYGEAVFYFIMNSWPNNGKQVLGFRFVESTISLQRDQHSISIPSLLQKMPTILAFLNSTSQPVKE